MTIVFASNDGREPTDLPSLGPDGDLPPVTSAGLVERRRSGLMRSAYAFILVAVFGFSAAVALSVNPGIDAADTLQPANLSAAANSPGLIESPAVTQGASAQAEEVHGHSHGEQAGAQLAPAQVIEGPALSGPLGAVAAGSNQTQEGRRGLAALDTISYPWAERLRGWTISFHPPRQGLYGLTLVSEKRIEIYLRDDESDELLAHVIAHEIGHAVDVTHNDGPERRIWSDAREIESAPWWPGDGATDFSTGAGDFAEAFAAWQVGGENFRSKLAGPPTAEQIEILEALSY